MYFKDGFVYGASLEKEMKITEVKALPDFIMLLTFNNGETRLFDALDLNGQAYEKLKDPAIFSCPIIDHGVVTWLNGEIDCAPEFMYEHSYEYSAAG